MLMCIVCSKQPNNETINEGKDRMIAPGTLGSKQAIKALTSQIKDMVVKASGVCKNCKPCSGSTNGYIQYVNYFTKSKITFGPWKFHCSYRREGSWNSLANISGIEMKGLSSGVGTPDSVNGQSEVVILEEEDKPREWVSQVESGVYITLVSLLQLGNNLKRIRFSRDLFDKYQAQRWWVENFDKVMELYNVQRYNNQSFPFPSPPRSIDEMSNLESGEDCPMTQWIGNNSGRTSYSSQTQMVGDESEEMSVSNISDLEREWIE